MTPKIISSEIFKYRKEISHDTLDKIVVKGGPVAIKEAIKSFGYKDDENIALPTIVIGGDGKIGASSGLSWARPPRRS